MRDDARGERGRGLGLLRLREFVDGRDQRLLESRSAFLDVERELGVARATDERPHEEAVDGAKHEGIADQPRRGDAGAGAPER